MLFEKLCRVCANGIRDEERAQDIFFGKRGKILQELESFTGEKLRVIEGLPNRICERCHSELELALKFRERYHFSQKYLLDMLIKKEGEAFEIDVARRQVVKRRRAKKKTGVAMDPLDVVINDTSDNEKALDIVLNDEVALSETEAEIELEVALEAVQEEAAKVMECGRIEGVEESAPELVKKRKRIANYFVCEKCGRYFNDQSNFKAHLARHAGKKNFKCQICAQEFYRKNELERHNLTHTNERPHQCSHCEKRFADRGSLQRHEKAHINARPYPCLECEKAFITSSELKHHVLVHSQGRAFSCTVCNKSFLRETHLESHYRSKFHIKNLDHKRNLENMTSAVYEEEDSLLDDLKFI